MGTIRTSAASHDVLGARHEALSPPVCTAMTSGANRFCQPVDLTLSILRIPPEASIRWKRAPD